MPICLKRVVCVSAYLAMVVEIAIAQSTDFVAVPLSPYAEQSGPNTVTVFSYPKYYQNHENQWIPVQTNFIRSDDQDWDYEVTTGIWSMFVRQDGTFSARHEGDVFTYRLAEIGVQLDDSFQALAWGQPNWTQLMVLGDIARWNDVYPGIDLKLRYIHDIMKVDVIVRQSARDALTGDSLAGQAIENGRLMFRFGLEDLQVNETVLEDAHGRQAMAGSFEVAGALKFVRGGKERHALLPAVAWVLDERGEVPNDGEPISAVQKWNGTEKQIDLGVALKALTDAPSGDIAIDPSMIFTGPSATRDTYLSTETPKGTADTITITSTVKALFGFNVDALPAPINILSAKIEAYVYDNNSPSYNYQAYAVTENWDEDTAAWTKRTSTLDWTTPGGTFTNAYAGTVTSSEANQQGWIEFDITKSFNSRFPTTYP